MIKTGHLNKVVIIALLAFIGFQSITIAMSSNSYDKSSFTQDLTKAQQVTTSIKNIGVVETLGPLSSVALSPFFGITCLSGSSILAEKGVIKTNNPFLKGNKALSSPLVFAAFLALTILTSVPKLTTVTKAFAELTDQAETYAGVISYLVIFAIANAASQQQPEQVVYAAGIFTFTKQTLLMAACVVNIIVINTVKFFFELLVLISPIPTVDAIFETANKAVAGFLAFVYVFNPWLSFVMNIIIFLFCLMIFGWAHRRVKYIKAIVLAPLWAKISRKTAADMDAKIRTKLSNQIADIKMIIKVFPAHKIKKLDFKKKQLLYLVISENKFFLAKPRIFSAPIIKEFETEKLQSLVETGIFSNSIVYSNAEGKRVYELLFSKVYNQNVEQIESLI